MQLKCQLFKEVLVAPGLDDVAPPTLTGAPLFLLGTGHHGRNNCAIICFVLVSPARLYVP